MLQAAQIAPVIQSKHLLFGTNEGSYVGGRSTMELAEQSKDLRNSLEYPAVANKPLPRLHNGSACYYYATHCFLISKGQGSRKCLIKLSPLQVEQGNGWSYPLPERQLEKLWDDKLFPPCSVVWGFSGSSVPMAQLGLLISADGFNVSVGASLGRNGLPFAVCPRKPYNIPYSSLC